MVRAAETKERKRRMKGRRGCKGSCRVLDRIPLPWELVSAILGRLPPRHLCRAIAVCKSWRREVGSPEFARQYARSGGWRDAPTLALTSLFKSQKQPSVAFSTELKRWVRVPTSFFHGKRTWFVAQAKGLYVHNVTCAPDWVGGPFKNTQLVVSSPLTGAAKWLPPMLTQITIGEPSSYVHLEIVEDGAAFMITCIDAEKDPCVEVYDSRSGYWTVFETPSLRSALNLCCCSKQESSVVLFGNVYFVAESSSETLPIVSFNLEDRVWRVVVSDFRAAAGAWYSDRGYHLPNLVVCGEKLIVVVLKLQKDCDAVVLSLDMERNVLVHETTLPTSLAPRMVSEGGLFVWPLFGQEHYLCSFDATDGRMVAYDFRTKQWDEWPASPVPHFRSSSCGSRLVDLQLGLLPLPDTRYKMDSRPALGFTSTICLKVAARQGLLTM